METANSTVVMLQTYRKSKHLSHSIGSAGHHRLTDTEQPLYLRVHAVEINRTSTPEPDDALVDSGGCGYLLTLSLLTKFSFKTLNTASSVLSGSATRPVPERVHIWQRR